MYRVKWAYRNGKAIFMNIIQPNAKDLINVRCEEIIEYIAKRINKENYNCKNLISGISTIGP